MLPISLKHESGSVGFPVVGPSVRQGPVKREYLAGRLNGLDGFAFSVRSHISVDDEHVAGAHDPWPSPADGRVSLCVQYSLSIFKRPVYDLRRSRIALRHHHEH